MKTIFRILPICVAVSAIAIYSCNKDITGTTSDNKNSVNIDKPHSTQIFLTDHQTPLFDSAFIDLQKLEIKVEDDSLNNDGWITLNINAGVYNILRLRNGLDTIFGTGTLPNARLQKIRLTLGNRNSVMLNGQSFALNIHDNENEVTVNLGDADFEVTAADQVLFWIDFDVAKSIREDNSGHGSGNGYRLEPHLNIFTKHKSGVIEGRVLPQQADALVMAINGTDTTMAVPEDDNGEFKILGLKAGSYSIFIDGNNGYIDTTINNIIVTNNEDSHLPDIFLHQ